MDHIQALMAAELEKLAAKSPTPTLAFRKGDGVTRKAIINAFQHTFEMIGGVSRFALWADANPSDFYKLYSRLIPPQITNDLDTGNSRRLILVLPRTRLDGPLPLEAEVEEAIIEVNSE
jgi:hypothetical protein